MRISDWSSDVCSSDLRSGGRLLFCPEAVAEVRGVEHLVPALERLLARAIRLEQGLEPSQRVRALVSLETRLRVVRAVGDGVALGARMVDHEIPVQTVADRLHRVVKRPVLAGGVRLVAFRDELRDPEPVQEDRKSPRLNSSHYCATRMPSSA